MRVRTERHLNLDYPMSKRHALDRTRAYQYASVAYQKQIQKDSADIDRRAIAEAISGRTNFALLAIPATYSETMYM